MLSIVIDPETESRLAAIASATGDAPDELARRALLAYLEDLEDYAIAVAAWKEFDPSQAISLEEIKRELGMAD